MCYLLVITTPTKIVVDAQEKKIRSFLPKDVRQNVSTEHIPSSHFLFSVYHKDPSFEAGNYFGKVFKGLGQVQCFGFTLASYGSGSGSRPKSPWGSGSSVAIESGSGSRPHYQKVLVTLPTNISTFICLLID